MEIICGDSSQWIGRADLIITNPYAPLPECLHGVPAVIVLSNRKGRKEKAEDWVSANLIEIGQYASGEVAVYIANLTPHKIEMDDLETSEFFPLQLPLRILKTYARLGYTIWDGFMGRGTVGKACQILGYDFIGIDIDPNRVRLAEEFLKCE